MDYIKLAQRTISMLNSMIESGECHTTRTKEMMNNAQNGLEQLRQYNIVVQSEQLKAFIEWQMKGNYPYAGMFIDEHMKEYFKSL